MTRSELNKRIGILVHAKKVCSEEAYRQIVQNIDAKSGGFVRNCGDEEANLVLLTLERLAEKRTSTREVKKHSRQENFIPVLMELLGWNWRQVSSFMMKIVKKSHTSKCDASELSKLIRALVAIIDHDIAKGKIVLTGERLRKYNLYTKNHHSQQSPDSAPQNSPLPLGEGLGERAGLERS